MERRQRPFQQRYDFAGSEVPAAGPGELGPNLAGFFLSTAKEGYEYVVTVAVVSIAIATFGAGEWSLDHAIDSSSFLFEPKKALAVAAIVGIGGAAAFLAVFWRPPKKAADAG